MEELKKEYYDWKSRLIALLIISIWSINLFCVCDFILELFVI